MSMVRSIHHRYRSKAPFKGIRESAALSMLVSTHLISCPLIKSNRISDFPNRQEIEYSHTFEHPQHPGYRQTSPRVPGGDHYGSQPTPYYPGQEQQALQGSYNNSPYGSTPLSGSMTTSPQSGTFHIQQTSPRSDQFSWAPQPPTRSMSIADTEDLHNAYAAYHRSSTYPSIARRMGTAQDAMHIQQQGVSPMYADSHHPVVTTAYHESTPYHPAVHNSMGWPSSMPPPSTRHPVAVSEAYGQSWYAQSHSGLPHVQEEENAHPYQAQTSHHLSFRPNPG